MTNNNYQQEYECCNPNYANSGVIGVGREARREMAVKKFENVIEKLKHDDDYIPLYKQIFKRLENETMKKKQRGVI